MTHRDFSQTFRDRHGEWGLSVITLIWGYSLLRSDVAVMTPFLHSLFAWCSPVALGIAMLWLGTCRLIALLVNGMWKRTPYVRMAMAAASAVIWGNVALSIMGSGVFVPGWITYTMFTVGELYFCYNAAVDARLKELAAAKAHA